MSVRSVSRRTFLRRAAVTIAVPLASCAYAREIEPFWLDLHDFEIRLANLPAAFEGFRIAQITDMHMDERVPANYLRTVVDRVNDARPDMVCVTGDIVNHTLAWVEQAAQLLSRLRAPTFASFGNHDYCPNSARPGAVTIISTPLHQCLWRVGCTVLRNRAVAIGRGKERIWLSGIEDYWAASFSPIDAFDRLPRRQGTSAVIRAATPARQRECVICMSHNPDSVPELLPFAPDLVLAGHTHGGQLRIPLIGGPILPLVDRRFDKGLFELENESQLYVSRGVGFLLRARLFCRPEVPIFVLRRAAT